MIDLAGLTDAEADQARGVLALLDRSLGNGVVAVILHGSAVASGLRPESDLDLLVVVRRPLTAAQRGTLIRGLLEASRSRDRPALPRHLEVTLVVEDDVRPWRYPPRLEFQYGDWWRSAFEEGVDAPWTSPNPDLAIVLSAARSTGRALVGPRPADVLDPVPRADLDAALRAVVPDLLVDLVDDTRNVLLTLARIVRTLETGAIEPKDAAADAVAQDLAAAGVDPGVVAALGRAADGYRGAVADPWDDDQAQDAARAAAAVLVARIEAPSGSPGA